VAKQCGHAAVAKRTADRDDQGRVRLTFHFSGECPGPRESTKGHLSRPDDLIGHPDVQDRLHLSTTVVSTALATCLFGQSHQLEDRYWSIRTDVLAGMYVLVVVTGSPVVDREYPPTLLASGPVAVLDKKLYLTSGVAAAFECKLTLNAAHITEATKTAAEIARMTAPRSGTPYQELVSPIVYGVLAHAHGWSSNDVAALKITEYYARGTEKNTTHAREYLDLVCVANFATFLKSTEFKLLTNLPDETPNQVLCMVESFSHRLTSNPLDHCLHIS